MEIEIEILYTDEKAKINDGIIYIDDLDVEYDVSQHNLSNNDSELCSDQESNNSFRSYETDV
jgi:hypothetical protein